ncbi:hypothetical protein PQ455_10465 [Sphingomonas naphthae]|uniref:MotA/TolQ/ExbB proton channel domain-containing protein n=1 Tax=Sphingomonas naphthae TaxID=1813468 RepID=A0ABY7TGY2_9SPHN|nr:hypothetical protein [Sphingomonas naphthae]WCT72071.1 hypothetical protein PQ455_10465 [Sphingomonas naphthae]
MVRQAIAGPVFGAGLASVASAMQPGPMPSFGPSIIIVAGWQVPVLSALFGVLGVFLARRVAPASEAGAKLGRSGNAALTILLALGVLGLVIAGEKRPIIALGWSVGLGYSGLAFVAMVAKSVMTLARVALDAWAAAWSKKGSDDVV